MDAPKEAIVLFHHSFQVCRVALLFNYCTVYCVYLLKSYGVIYIEIQDLPQERPNLSSASKIAQDISKASSPSEPVAQVRKKPPKDPRLSTMSEAQIMDKLSKK